jgi:Glucodextranase, domain B
MKKLNSFYKRHPVWSWIIAGFIVLVVIAAAVPADENGSPEPSKSERAVPAKFVGLRVSGVRVGYSETVTVTGMVDPPNASVTVNGRAVDVSNGRFRTRVNPEAATFGGASEPIEVHARAPGYKPRQEFVDVEHKLTRAMIARHRAQVRARKARARAAARLRRERERQQGIQAQQEQQQREAQQQQEPQAQCHPAYDPCLDPNASDYDCEGGSGDGPKYTGPVTVKDPSDSYDLDRDGDGHGCD